MQVPMPVTKRLRFNEDLAVRPATYSCLHKGKCHGAARHHENVPCVQRKVRLHCRQARQGNCFLHV